MTKNEQSEVAVLLDLYGKSDRTDWAKFKNRLKSEVADKWDKAVIECRRDGFIGPYAYLLDGSLKIGWWQVLERDGASVKMDECAMCERGLCPTDTSKDFVTCWQEKDIPF